MMARTGRRPGKQDTREAILTSAREAFSERGFDGASIRAIASAAGVDPALVHHYFGPKEQLFLAAVNIPIDPASAVTRVLTGDPDQLGQRLVRQFLSVWDSPVGTTAAALFRSSLHNEWTGRLLREFIVTQVLRRVIAQRGLERAEAELRVSLVASQMVGLAMTRYLLQVEPMASAPAEQIVTLIGPTIQRYMADDLPGLADLADPPQTPAP